MEVRFFDDPVMFLDVAGDVLAEQPLVSTVVASVAERVRLQREAGIAWPEGVPCWFAAVIDGDEVVGTAMRTAPFGSYPAFVLPMPAEAVHVLTGALLDRDEPVLSANGTLPEVEVFCDDMARATGRTTNVERHTRLFERGSLVEPRPTSGALRPARLEEQPLIASWYDAFMVDADEQAGRATGHSAHESPSAEELTRRIELGRTFVWVDDDDRPVNLTAATMPAYGISRIGPVFTPKDERGHGYASAAVHAVSKLLRDSGEEPCLFTDQANPTSNKIYEAIGYRRLVDMANLVIE